ncbi:MAG TPA: TolC family protein [Thermoanaerobaculia bacterium]|nr:TolC family protein [Thermoanaerobaculia bacterium]
MHRLALAGLVSALVAAAGGAQDSPIVTEAEFLSALDASHPAVAEAAEELALARARVVEASTLDNPAVGVAREDPSGPVEQTDLLVSWRLPHLARRPEVEAREAAVRAASARTALRLRTLHLEMREVYAAWALAAARQERLSAQAERVATLAARESARAEWGEASGLEAHRLTLATEALRARVALAAAARERGRAEAARWVPTLPGEARPVVPELPPAPSFGNDDPRVRAAEAELAAARLEREAASRFLASPELSVGWQRQDSGAKSLEGPVLGIAWSVPLFDRNQAEQAAAEARVAAAEARLELVRREVASSRDAALTSFELLASSLGEARSALVASERMLDGAEAAFRLGEATLTDLLETHRSVTEGELAVLDLQEAALEAHRQLERLAALDDTSQPSATLQSPDLETLP